MLQNPYAKERTMIQITASATGYGSDEAEADDPEGGVAMTDDDGGVLDDLSASLELVEAPAAKGGKGRDGRHAPPGFNPAAVFLLGLGWVNLFEPVGRDGTVFRCKGCGDETVKTTAREAHFNKHKRASEKPLPRRQPTTTTTEGEHTMANNKQKDDKPRVSKTKTAREVAISVLKAANKPMTMPDLVAKVLADQKIKAAGVPERTIQAQVNFELAEKSPVIVRVDRGVYAHKDAADKKPPAKPEGAKRTTSARKATTTVRKPTAKRSTASKIRKSTAPRKTARKTGQAQVKPDPKPGARQPVAA